MPAIPMIGSSEETLGLEQQMNEQAQLDWGQSYDRAMLESQYGHSLSKEIYGLIGGYEGSKGPMISKEQANTMYPKDMPWEKEVSTLDAINANEEFRNNQKLQEIMQRTNVSGVNNVASLGGMLVGGTVNDPVMMAGAMLSGMAFTATAGAGMTASLYNTFSGLGANWVRAAAATAITEAAGSMLFDIPALLVTQAIVNNKESTGVQMSGKEVATGVLMGAAFAGMIGGVTGAASRNTISASAAGLKKAADVQAELQSKGIAVDVNDTHFSIETLRDSLDAQGKEAFDNLDAEGFYAVGHDGRMFSNIDMVKQMRNLELKEIVQYKNTQRLTRRQFVEEAAVIIGDDPNKGSILELFNRLSPFDIFNKTADIEIPEVIIPAFTKVIDELKARYKHVIVDDLEVGAPSIAEVGAKLDSSLGETSPIRGEFTDAEGNTFPIWNRDKYEQIVAENEAIATNGSMDIKQRAVAENLQGNDPTGAMQLQGNLRMRETGDAVTRAMQAYAQAEDAMITKAMTTRSIPVWEADYPLTKSAQERMDNLGGGFKEYQNDSAALFSTDLNKTIDQLAMDVEAMMAIGQKFNKDGGMRKGGLQDRNIKGLSKSADMQVKAQEAPKPTVEDIEVAVPAIVKEHVAALDKALDAYHNTKELAKKTEHFAGLFKLLDDCK